MTILPHHIAGIFLLGGLTVGSYFTVNALTPPSLESKLKNLNLELVSTEWGEKAQEYKKDGNNNLIPSIDKSKQEREIATLLEGWCKKKKDKYFLGNTDISYRNFSVWCTVTKTIKNVLVGRRLKELDPEGWTQKFTAYSADTNTDKFITPNKGVTEEKLKDWCRDTQANTNYTYEGDETLNKILSWCYANS
ncbi:hypothetical protein A6V39_03245 [Candidatus Mycoplasma haematobovis]|uniref:Uncharacterized protein n=1 Tax=Candidatus Mycoplasma haematobovis TaxID=432608 RepID=A0A1A9QDZ9_9MOLU|nr:hypothetical protein [Candidatus Mycoplasma haematobovis]OAL09900.1 hypothetical protein A6V39_03245 [Candidatus Mycoplasma haematobovis]